MQNKKPLKQSALPIDDLAPWTNEPRTERFNAVVPAGFKEFLLAYTAAYFKKHNTQLTMTDVIIMQIASLAKTNKLLIPPVPLIPAAAAGDKKEQKPRTKKAPVVKVATVKKSKKSKQ